MHKITKYSAEKIDDLLSDHGFAKLSETDLLARSEAKKEAKLYQLKNEINETKEEVKQPEAKKEPFEPYVVKNDKVVTVD